MRNNALCQRRRCGCAPDPQSCRHGSFIAEL